MGRGMPMPDPLLMYVDISYSPPRLLIISSIPAWNVQIMANVKIQPTAMESLRLWEDFMANNLTFRIKIHIKGTIASGTHQV